MSFLYAGSFDPITKGHEWIIQNAPKPLIVAVAHNPDKKYRFTLVERMELVRQSIPPMVQLCIVENEYLIEFALRHGVNYIVRGVRSSADYEYERAYAGVNRTIAQGGQHLLMMPPPDLCSVSSSVVKSLVGPPGWERVLASYVSPHVLEALRP